MLNGSSSMMSLALACRLVLHKFISAAVIMSLTVSVGLAYIFYALASRQFTVPTAVGGPADVISVDVVAGLA